MDLESFLEYSTEWDDQGDQQSFEDSDRFEDESYDSMGSDTESLCPNNWRGWKKPGGSERSSDRPVHLNVGSIASVGAVPDKDPEGLSACVCMCECLFVYKISFQSNSNISFSSSKIYNKSSVLGRKVVLIANEALQISAFEIFSTFHCMSLSE